MCLTWIYRHTFATYNLSYNELWQKIVSFYIFPTFFIKKIGEFELKKKDVRLRNFSLCFLVKVDVSIGCNIRIYKIIEKKNEYIL